MNSLKIFAVVVLAGLLFFSCKKEDDVTPEPVAGEDVAALVTGAYAGFDATTSEAMTVEVEKIDNNTIAISAGTYDAINISIIKNPSDPNIINNEFGTNDGITAVFNLEEKLLTLIDEQQGFSFSGNLE
jgi:hypothetical protein